MLVDVLALPPLRHQIIERRHATSTEQVFADQNILPFGPDQLALLTPNLVLGGRVQYLPHQLYKAIYITSDQHWVLEVVYAMGTLGCHCLYVKTLGNAVDIMIPAATIRNFADRAAHSFTLGELLSESYYHCSAPLVFSATVPPIFSDRSLREEIWRLVSAMEERFSTDRLQQLYLHEPAVLEALLRGTFTKPPHYALVNPVPHVFLHRPRWSLLEEEEFNNKVSPGRSFANHPAFDEIALSLLWLRPTELKFSILMSHAVDGLVTFGVTNHLRDAYQHTLPDVPRYLSRIHEKIREIMIECMEVYCTLFGYDPVEFTKGSQPHSVLVLEKNLYDEVTIVFRDQLHRTLVRFYTSFPAIALSTWGMARGL